MRVSMVRQSLGACEGPTAVVSMDMRESGLFIG